MAKKTQKENIAPAANTTVASKAAAKVAENIFKRNSEIKEVHVASDGTAFYIRSDAQNHAKTLSNREVFSFKRGAVQSVSAAAKQKQPETKGAPAANKEEEVDELTGNINSDESDKSEE